MNRRSFLALPLVALVPAATLTAAADVQRFGVTWHCGGVVRGRRVFDPRGTTGLEFVPGRRLGDVVWIDRPDLNALFDPRGVSEPLPPINPASP